MRQRVFITGMGSVSPMGLTLGEAWEAAMAGRMGCLGPMEEAWASGLPWAYAGRVRGLDLGARGIGPKDAIRYDPFVLYAYVAASEAVREAGLGGADGALRGGGVVIGSSRGGIGTIERTIRGRRSAYAMMGSTVGMASSYIAARMGIEGHALGISNACASGVSALGEAARMIRHGGIEVAIAGGAEAPVSRVAVEGYGVAGALSRRGEVCPFGSGRDGFVLSEGAAVMVLEGERSVRARGASVLAEIVGYGHSTDAGHPTLPDAGGQLRAIRGALADAGIGAGQVGVVYAHATATRSGDEVEARVIAEAYGGGVPVVAIKGATGHMLGASGVMEAAFAVLGIGQGALPASPGCAGTGYEVNVSERTRRLDHERSVVHSFGFGGVNAALVLSGCTL